ncbi:MAG: hypothetical protein II718_02730 [Clostridiales bacterium]|nr:hypothetical protein [Clostridiales bacterium]
MELTFNKKRIDIIRGLLLLSLVPFLFLLQDLVTDIFLSVIIVTAAGALLINVPVRKQTGKTFIFTIVMTAVFVIMFSLREMGKSGLYSGDLSSWLYPGPIALLINIWKYTLLPGSFFISSFICIRLLLDRLMDEGRTDEGDKKKTVRICMIIISAVSLIYAFSVIPAINTAGDVDSVWTGVANHNWSAWHTFGYQLYVFICSKIFPSIFTVILCDTLIFLILNFYILTVLSEVSTRAVKIYTALGIIASTPYIYLEDMIKDVVFSIGMLALCCGLFRVIRNKEMKKTDMAVIFLIPLFVSLCRHMGIVSVLITFLAAGIYFLKTGKKKISLAFAGGILLHVVIFFLINSVLAGIMKVDPNPAYVKYSTPIAMIGAAADSGVEFSSEDMASIEKLMPYEKWADCYNRYYSDDLTRSWGDIGDDAFELSRLVEEEGFGKDIIRINFHLVTEHPVIYLRALFDMNSIIWEMHLPYECNKISVAQVQPNDSHYHMFFFYLTRKYTKFMDDLSITRALFYRGGVSLFLCGVYAAVMKMKKRSGYLIVLIPSLLNTLMLSITVPAQDTRYILPLILVCIFLTSVMFSGSGSPSSSCT